MRQRSQLQLYIRPASLETTLSQELLEIDRILEKVPDIAGVLSQILLDLGARSEQKGREGMCAEQVLRAGLIRMRLGLCYRDLEHATQDSLSIREFLKIGYGRGFKKSSLQKNIKRVKDSTWEMLNNCLKAFAVGHGIEDGKKIRTDTTCSETNIHYPTDGTLLNDSVRVLTRVMTYAQELGGAPIDFMNHYRATKKKVYKLNNTSKRDKRHQLYLELIRLTRSTLRYAEQALEILREYDGSRDLQMQLVLQKSEIELERYIPLVGQVIDQAYRRLVLGETLTADEKIVSLFEPHTDILVKGLRDVAFGHKVCITEGASSLILDVKVLDGNPADSELVPGVIDRHMQFYGTAPKEAVFDGCFASAANRNYAKQNGIEELTFSKNRYLDINSLVSSQTVHRKLRNFRAGIEACISYMKRIFGWSRILDKGKQSFAATIQAAAAAYNLTVLARYRLRAV